MPTDPGLQTPGRCNHRQRRHHRGFSLNIDQPTFIIQKASRLQCPVAICTASMSEARLREIDDLEEALYALQSVEVIAYEQAVRPLRRSGLAGHRGRRI